MTILLLTTLFGCGDDKLSLNQELLYGEWRINSINGVVDGYDEFEVYLDFQENGTVTLCSEDVCLETLWEFVPGSTELLELSNSNYLFFSNNTPGLLNRPVEFILVKSTSLEFLSIDVIKKINETEVDRRSVELSR